METDDRCDCGAPLGVLHTCPSMPTMGGDDMHPTEEPVADWIEALGPEPMEVCP